MFCSAFCCEIYESVFSALFGELYWEDKKGVELNWMLIWVVEPTKGAGGMNCIKNVSLGRIIATSLSTRGKQTVENCHFACKKLPGEVRGVAAFFSWYSTQQAVICLILERTTMGILIVLYLCCKSCIIICNWVIKIYWRIKRKGGKVQWRSDSIIWVGLLLLDFCSEEPDMKQKCYIQKICKSLSLSLSFVPLSVCLSSWQRSAFRISEWIQVAPA